MILINDSNDSVTVYTYNDDDTVYWVHARKFTIPPAHLHRHEKDPNAPSFRDTKLAIRINDDPRHETQQPKSGAHAPGATVRIDAQHAVTHPSSLLVEPLPNTAPSAPNLQGSEIRDGEGLISGNDTKLFTPSRNHYLTLDQASGLQFWQAAPAPKQL